MKLMHFLKQLARMQPAKPEETNLRFKVGDGEFLSVQTVEFDVGANAWTVHLAKASG